MWEKRKAIVTAIIFIAAILGLLSLRFIHTPQALNYSVISASTLNKNLNTSTVKIGNHLFTVEIAQTMSEQALGLSNRKSLAKNTGMIFPFNPPSSPAFWMKDMQFSLDLVWIANNKVIGVSKDLPTPVPGTTAQNLPTYTPPQTVDLVLEINAGEASSIQVGDTVIVTENKKI